MTCYRSYTSIFASQMASFCTSRCMSSLARPSCTNASLKASKAWLNCVTCRATKCLKPSKKAKWSSQTSTERRRTSLLLRYSRKSRHSRLNICQQVQLVPNLSSQNPSLRSISLTMKYLLEAWFCKCQGQMTRYTSHWSSKRGNLSDQTA